MTLFGIIAGCLIFYLFLTLLCFYVFHQFPRRPVSDRPDWGVVTDTTIETRDKKKIEVWKITPDVDSREGPRGGSRGGSRGVVVLAHGWGRNRDRMVNRARVFSRLNFTCVIHSARDHGNSSPKKMMNAIGFAEDIEAVIQWVDEPVILYGHSAGAAGAIIAASRIPSAVGLLVLEACYPETVPALLSLYRWVNPFVGRFIGPMIILWMRLFYGEFKQYDPNRLARGIQMPVLIVHGEKDRRFPVEYAHQLQGAFEPEQAGLFVGKGAGHSDSSLSTGYDDAVESFTKRWEQEMASV